jgi:hypothetical protein
MKESSGIRIISLLTLGLFFYLRLPIAQATDPMRITVEQNTVSIHAGERIVMRYRYKGVPFKPYVDRLFSPQGVNVLRDAPADHLHHHALMFAVSVDGVNFWEEREAPGRQEHQAFTDVMVEKHGDIPWAGLTEQLTWLNPSGEELLLNEHRTMRLCQPSDPNVTLLTWQSHFEVPAGRKSATLTGSHYFGLGMRFVESMDKLGRFLNADGKAGEVFRGDERLVQSAWCAYSAKANGPPRRVTVAIFDHPQNCRLATWFTMTEPFAYLSATLNLHRQPLKIQSGEPLVLRYGVALWDGQVNADRVSQLYRRWLKEV